MMEAVVPQEITAELTQILSNLVLGDNEIRANAEKAVNDRLARTPELYLLALAQFAIAADTEVFSSADCSFAPRPCSHTTTPRNHDYLSTPQTLTTLERLLLHSLSHEPLPSVRKKSVDTICDVTKQRMVRGRLWHALQAQTFTMTPQEREGTTGEPAQLAQSLSLMHPILETIHTLPQSLSSPPPPPTLPSQTWRTSPFLSALTPLCSTDPSGFAPHLPALLIFEAKPGMVRKVVGWMESCVRRPFSAHRDLEAISELQQVCYDGYATTTSTTAVPE
ncbi:hypothetical protein D9611_014696 [Ephemerocybe angulata]|uniref:Uncharacterized protein n=1 Tax=Ephemerocybe angulata TaxID=980116 RepID=A0A8H5EZM1_9AGAR|nr:hypothetical protein D9611_014696 [Tulosesus angulatus]